MLKINENAPKFPTTVSGKDRTPYAFFTKGLYANGFDYYRGDKLYWQLDSEAEILFVPYGGRKVA